MKIKNVITYFKYEYIKRRAFRTITSQAFQKSHPEYVDEIKYIRKRKKLLLFPYPYIEKYVPEKFPIFIDDISKIPYVIYKNKKLFFNVGQNLNLTQIQWKYSCLASEQDDASPHKYFTDEFKVEQNDIFIDIGCAEGKEALDVVGVAQELYLFECDLKWQNALKMTFSEKQIGELSHNVKIINKFVSDKSTDECIRLDDIVPGGDSLFIKIDVEGTESDVLKSAQNIIEKSKRCRIAVACYHNNDDAEKLTMLLSEMGFKCWFTPGYMLYFYNDTSKFIYPYFRHGVIRAEKGNY